MQTSRFLLLMKKTIFCAVKKCQTSMSYWFFQYPTLQTSHYKLTFSTEVRAYHTRRMPCGQIPFCLAVAQAVIFRPFSPQLFIHILRKQDARLDMYGSEYFIKSYVLFSHIWLCMAALTCTVCSPSAPSTQWNSQSILILYEIEQCLCVGRDKKDGCFNSL